MMVLMVVVVTAAVTLLMMVLMMVVVATAVTFFMMVLMMVVVTAAAVTILMVMMVMMLLLFHLRKLGGKRRLAVHGFQQLLTGQLMPGCGNEHGFCIVRAEQRNRRIQFILGDGIGTGQNDRSGSFHLIVIKLAKVFHVNLDLACVHNRHGAAQLHCVTCHFLYRRDHIGQLTHAGGLDHDPVGGVLCDHLLQCLAEVAHQRAADTAGVHFLNVDTCLLQKAAVNADLTKFVFDQHQFLACISLLDHFLD